MEIATRTGTGADHNGEVTAGSPADETRDTAEEGRAPEGGRDLPLDFLRGMAMVVLIVDHLAWYRNESLSLYHLLALDRLGTVRAAEAFLIIAGIVLGMVTRRRIAHGGFGHAAKRLKDRAVQLYLVNIVISAIFVVLRHVPGLDTATFLPPPGWYADDVKTTIANVLLMRDAPWHINVLGLYVALLLLAIPATWLMAKGETRFVLGLSLVAYGINQAYHDPLTRALFEDSFPILTYQVVFTLGLVAGYHREAIEALFTRRPDVMRAIVIGSAIAAAGFILYATIGAYRWDGGLADRLRWDVLGEDRYWAIYDAWFDRWTLGVGRILNILVLLVLGYAILRRWWEPINRLLGWFFIPIGQASLYVFAVHIFIALVTEQVGPLHEGRVLLNTAAHSLALAIIWLLVRYRVGWRWIPR